MTYLKLSTMEYPRYVGDIALEYSDFDGINIPSDYVAVEQTTPPTYDLKTQYLDQTAPIQVDGVWQSVWVVQDYTAEQLAEIKAQQDKIMANHRKPMPTNVDGAPPSVIT